jgi:hypothetical protein
MNKILYLAVFGSAALAGSIAASAETLDETSNEILAARVRDQGFACDKAVSAQPEQKQSKPNETVWILTCEDDTYRLTLVPDLAAKVEKIKR